MCGIRKSQRQLQRFCPKHQEGCPSLVCGRRGQSRKQGEKPWTEAWRPGERSRSGSCQHTEGNRGRRAEIMHTVWIQNTGQESSQGWSLGPAKVREASEKRRPAKATEKEETKEDLGQCGVREARESASQSRFPVSNAFARSNRVRPENCPWMKQHRGYKILTRAMLVEW